MPLDKSASDAARSKNIAAEIRAGKDPKQAAAIGYSVQREAKKKNGKTHTMPDGTKMKGAKHRASIKNSLEKAYSKSEEEMVE